MTINLRVAVAPTAEPLTLGEAMDHLNIELDDRHKDEFLLRTIAAVRRRAEEVLNFPLTDAVYEYRINAFSNCMPLPLGQIREITGITYIDADGAEQELAETVYSFDDNPRAPEVHLAYGASWPSTRNQSNAVVIRFQGNFSETDSPPRSPPEDIKLALGMMLASIDDIRQAVVIGAGAAIEIPQGAMFYLWPHRCGLGV